MNVLCLKLRARRTWAPPPASSKPRISSTSSRMTVTRHKQTENMSPPLQITEDTPPDMLAGSMDLSVVLPNGNNVRMSVERSTPMMDLLVQVTTANKISPAGHVIQAVGERGVMPYKPSTPIGALDTWTIYIVPKNQVGQLANRKASYKSVGQPFEQTFRLQVHLPRNQLYVSRISPKTRVSDILLQVCSEKNLDPSKYSLRHPVNLDQVLNGSNSLADYKLQEVALVSNRSRPVSVSTVDIMALHQQHPDNFNAVRNHHSCEGSLSSGSLGGRSLSPTRSDGSSASPPPLAPPVPHRPIRKRRPAPKPPVNNNNNNSSATVAVNNVVNKNNSINGNPAVDNQQLSAGQSQSGTVICHSRNSSDSSGYHEASVLSESPESNSLPDSLPRRSKLPSNVNNLESKSNVKSAGILSRSLSNLSTAVGSAGTRSMKTLSTSSTSLIAIGRKKKAAPAPPQARPLTMCSVSEERQKDASCPQSPLALEDEERNNISRKSSTLPASIRVTSASHPELSVEVGSNSSSSSVCAPDSVSGVPPSTHIYSSLDLLKNTPSEEQPKPKPRTIFETDSVDTNEITNDETETASSILSSSSSVAGDGYSDSTTSTVQSQVVNKPKTLRSRKSYPAPLPKPRSSQTLVSSSNESTETISHRIGKEDIHQRIPDVDHLRTWCANEVDTSKTLNETSTNNSYDSAKKSIKSSREELIDNVEPTQKNTDSISSGNENNDSVVGCEKEDCSSRIDNESINCECQEVFPCPSDTFNTHSVSESSSSSSSSTMTLVPDITKTVKPKTFSLSEEILVDHKRNSDLVSANEKGRNFSAGNLNEVAAFLVSNGSSELGRWPNAECLPESSSDACFITEADTETKTNSSSSELRMDDEEIDRIFGNAMRDHTSLESGVGDLPSPPLSITHSLDWEYRLPAPPTFRDDTTSPVMTVFDTVTIGNLTDVFQPESLVCIDKNITAVEPDLVNNVAVADIQPSPKALTAGDAKQESSSNLELVKTINKTADETCENESTNIDVSLVKSNLVDQSTKPDLIKHVEEEKEIISHVSNCGKKREKNVRVNDKEKLDNVRKTAVEINSNNKTTKSKQVDARANVLDNFVIMTYQESGGKRSVEVFEDDSVKSSSSASANCEHKSATRDKAVFRIPKSIPRRCSFGSDDKRPAAGRQQTVKRSASIVSLLAGNVARGHGDRSRLTNNMTGEFSIAQGDEERSKLGDWRNTGSVGLQSLQVLRSILPQLNNSQDSLDRDDDEVDYSKSQTTNDRVASDLEKKFERSHSEEASSNDYYSLRAPPAPSVSLSTWNERPKRQVSIKTDRDYCYGIGKHGMTSRHSPLEQDTLQDATEHKRSSVGVNFSSEPRQKDLDKPDIIKHSTTDLSHVPVVRAVELKKKPYFSTSCVDVTDLGRCGFFHGRSFENLSSLDNDSNFGKTNTIKASTLSSKESFKSQQNINSSSEKEESTSYSGVNSLVKRFGQQKAITSSSRPVSYYLYGSGAYDNKQVDENTFSRQPASNTSRVMLNSERRFTSVVGINSDASERSSPENGASRKALFSSTSQNHEQPSNRVLVNGTSPNDDKIIINSTKTEIKNNVNNSLEFIKAQSKISSGGIVMDSPPRRNETECPAQATSFQQQSVHNVSSVKLPVKPVLKPTALKKAKSSGGIPPPPPIMPTLKPVGERRNARTLPRVDTDPRDQLLDSIRNFGGLKSLKKISSK